MGVKVLSSELRPRTRLGVQVSKYIAGFERYDYEDLSIIIANDIIKKLIKINLKNIDNRIEEIREACIQAGFLGIVCSICKIVDILYNKIKNNDKNKEKLINKIKNYSLIFEKLIAMRKNSIQSISSVLANDLTQDATLFLAGLVTSIVEITSGVQYRLERVYVPIKDPFGSGKVIASQLRKRQVRVYQLPDSHILWALQGSHAVLGVIVGSTDTGKLIVEAGFEPIASIATSLQKKIYVAQPLMSLCSYREDLLRSIVPGFIVTNKQGLSLRFRSIDVIDPEDYDVFIVNENEVQKATRELIKARQSALIDVFSDTLNYLAG